MRHDFGHRRVDVEASCLTGVVAPGCAFYCTILLHGRCVCRVGQPCFVVLNPVRKLKQHTPTSFVRAVNAQHANHVAVAEDECHVLLRPNYTKRTIPRAGSIARDHVLLVQQTLPRSQSLAHIWTSSDQFRRSSRHKSQTATAHYIS